MNHKQRKRLEHRRRMSASGTARGLRTMARGMVMLTSFPARQWFNLEPVHRASREVYRDGLASGLPQHWDVAVLDELRSAPFAMDPGFTSPNASQPTASPDTQASRRTPPASPCAEDRGS